MRKQLFSMTNQKGFFLPYVLFITATTLIIITASINIYNQDIRLTEKHLDQLKIETLIQMSRTRFKGELIERKDETGELEYLFPDGRVLVEYLKIRETEYALKFKVYTGDNSVFVITNRLKVPVDK